MSLGHCHWQQASFTNFYRHCPILIENQKVSLSDRKKSVNSARGRKVPAQTCCWHVAILFGWYKKQLQSKCGSSSSVRIQSPLRGHKEYWDVTDGVSSRSWERRAVLLVHRVQWLDQRHVSAGKPNVEPVACLIFERHAITSPMHKHMELRQSWACHFLLAVDASSLSKLGSYLSFIAWRLFAFNTSSRGLAHLHPVSPHFSPFLLSGEQRHGHKSPRR